MKATDTTRLLALAVSVWPQMRIEETTPDAWHLALSDLPVDAALGALGSLSRVRTAPPAPADIRREVARTAGLLAPDEDVAYLEAVNVSSRDGEGRRALSPPVRDAYDSCGGASGMRGRQDVLRAQFRDAYRAARTRYETDLLAGDLGPALEGATRPALAAL